MKKIFTLIFLTYAINLVASEHLKIECSIFNINGELVKKFPGHHCAFNSNGEHAEFDESSVRYFDEKNNLKWTHKGNYHHQLKISQDGQTLVVLGESKHKVMNCTTRFDTVEVYNAKTGQLLKLIDAYDLFAKVNWGNNISMSVLRKAGFSKIKSKVTCTTTHINSINEIQLTANVDSNELANGNWVLNFSWNGIILVFDKYFEKITKEFRLEDQETYYHDIQLASSDKMIMYMNNYELIPNEDGVSAILEFNPLEKKISPRIVILKNDGKEFLQDTMGGVQYLKDGNKIVSVYNDHLGYQVAFMDKNWNTYKKITPFPMSQSNYGSSFQEAKIVDLSDFFKNYQGP